MKRKILKKILTLVLCLVLCLPFAQITAADNSVGAGLNWSLGAGGVLTITGTGTMKDFSAPITEQGGKQVKITTAPWGEFYSSIQSVVIGSGVNNVGDYAFCGCENVKSVTLPETVTDIGAVAFSNCQKLTEVEIPSGVTQICDYAFYNCISLATVTFKGDIMTRLGSYSFTRCKMLDGITLPSSLEVIGYGAFSDCDSLISITIPDKVKNINYDTFYSCDSLAYISFPQVENIYESAFEGCKSLESITLPLNLKYIGVQAFSGDSKISCITIPTTVEKIDVRAFQYDSFADVYFEGTKDEWNAINVCGANDGIDSAVMHYNYKNLPEMTAVQLSSSRVLSWWKESGASGYFVHIDIPGKTSCRKVVTETSYDLKTEFYQYLTKENYYEVKVCALDSDGDALTKDWSGIFYYGDAKSQLTDPEPTLDAEGLLQWKAVPDATQYDIRFYSRNKKTGWENLIYDVNDWTGTWLNFRDVMTQEFDYRYSICAYDSTSAHTKSKTVWSDWVSGVDGEFYGIYVNRIPVTSKNRLSFFNGNGTVEFYESGEEYGIDGKTLVLDSMKLDKGYWHTSEDGCKSMISIDSDISVYIKGSNYINVDWEDDLIGIYVMSNNTVNFYGDGTLNVNVSRNGGRALAAPGSYINLHGNVIFNLTGHYGFYSSYESDGYVGELDMYDSSRLYAYGLRDDDDKEGRAVMCPEIIVEDNAFFYAEYEWNQRAVETWGTSFAGTNGQSGLKIRGIKNVSGQVSKIWSVLKSLNAGSGTPHEEDYRALAIQSGKSGVTSVSYVDLDRHSYMGATNKMVQLEATVYPDNASNKAITWKSSDEKVATVDQNGLVKILRYGTAKITANSVDGSGCSACCVVNGLFNDVTDSSRYWYKSVYWAAENNITTGYDKVYFGPEENCTRRQLMTFLWRMAGCPESTNKPEDMFSDWDLSVYPKTSAAYKSVAWGISAGITKGFNDGTFRPDANITRKDIMIMIYRFAGKPAWSATRGAMTFTDVKGVYKEGTDTYNAICWAYNNKITNGYSSGEYAGQFGCMLPCLRKDIVTFLYRYDNLK